MQAIIESASDNATSSWYGFESQGRIGLLYFLQRLNSIEQDQWFRFLLEYEYMEDFSICCIDENKEFTYQSIYQVKARNHLPRADIEKVYGELGFKKSIFGDETEVYLISKCEVDEELEIKPIIEEYIQKHIDEIQILSNLEDINQIKINLNKKNSNSQLKLIRNLVRIEFSDLNKITIDNIKNYCEELLRQYERFKENISEINVNIIIEDFENINKSISENIKCILEKLYPNETYRHEESYLVKVRNALFYLLSNELELYMLQKNKIIFRITSEKIIDILSKDHNEINELQYLYFNSEKLDNEFKKYCEYECINKINCEECNITVTLSKIKRLDLEKFKSLLSNSNPDKSCNPTVEIDYNQASSMLETSKLENFIFDQIEKNKYDIDDINKNIYLRSINESYLFSFIDWPKRKQDSLKRRLDANVAYNRHIYEDNDVILNCNINTKFSIGETLACNQHWDTNEEGRKETIMETSIELKSFDSIGE